jgi:hypothetical protein
MQPHRQNRLFRHLTVAAVAAFALLATGNSAADAGTAGAPIELAGDKPAFTIDVSNAKAKVGESATIKVSVKAAPGFKCNDKYKHKIKKLKADGGAKLAADKVMGTVKGKKVHFEVAVTPTKKGKAKVSGQIRFSVCNDSQCVIKKVPLNATVTGT